MSFIGAAIVGGGAILGGAIQANAAGSAADAAGDAADSAIAEQRAARLAFDERVNPFVNFGTDAANELSRFLGISGGDAQTQVFRDARNKQNQQLKKLRAERKERIAGGHGTVNVDKRIAKTQLRQERAIENLREQQAISTAPSQLQDPTQQLAEINPVLSFLRDQGFEAIQESAAAGGRLGAGGTLKDLTQFNTDLTSTIVPQIQNQRFNQLFSAAGLGANAAAGAGSAALSTAANIGNLQTGAGQAQAGGIIGQSNAFTGGIQNALGAFGQFQAQQQPQFSADQVGVNSTANALAAQPTIDPSFQLPSF